MNLVTIKKRLCYISNRKYHKLIEECECKERKRSLYRRLKISICNLRHRDRIHV